MSYIVVPPVTPGFGLSNFGITLQEMLDIISNEIGNVNINSLITSWINMIITDLASKYVFGTLHMYDTKNTSLGVPDVVLADDFYWLKTIAIPSQMRKLYPEDEQRISEGYPQYRSLQGTVSYYYLNGNLLGLWQVPSGTFSIEYSYQRRPNKLVNPDDVCDLPPEWHTLVIQKAITKGYSQAGDDSGFGKSLQLEAKLFKELQISAYRRPDETLMYNGKDVRNRIPRPRLPSNFPTSER